MQPLTGATAGAAASLVISRLNVPIIQRIDGYMNGTNNTTQYWLMFFAGTSVPANTTAPLFELQVVGKNGFSWDFGAQGGLDFTKMLSLFTGTLGLVVAISSTSATLTASAETMDIAVTVNEPFLPVAGLSVIGDLTTAVAFLNVWSQASGPKSLYNVVARNNSGTATQYLMLFPDEAINVMAGRRPLAAFALADGITLPLSFGVSGFSPKQNTTVELHACCLMVSSAPDIYTAVVGTPWTIQAFYK